MEEEVLLQDDDVEGSWTLLSWLASCLMVFGGALPYVPQYQEIQRSNNSEGFSTRVCLVLLIANILRIFFWIGKQFELTLLLQSVVMILAMFAMLHLCCMVQNTNRVSTKQHRLSDLDFRYFWKWSAFEDYLLFCFGFTVLCAVVTLLLLDSAVFVETLGSLAVMFEAMLGLPQLLQNFQNHSTKGMSVKMVLLWMAGDVFKTTYFVINESPTQFTICGSVQILIDVAILLQVLFYSQDTRAKLG
ncbi:solute carrier family 66 member 2 [Cheilinus undulatus]|uniref:solute carrier family 66 member 2 n=1 Tax=Cheilinus undulatus TaxID=241271 RepID=UPI001BD5A5A3|nr:solute carrier family 66 member 2 [Cheilinus undulatus]XP_041651252.1 solute carrier family 66 member 2 [Cheilinus undulatus]